MIICGCMNVLFRCDGKGIEGVCCTTSNSFVVSFVSIGFTCVVLQE